MHSHAHPHFVHEYPQKEGTLCAVPTLCANSAVSDPSHHNVFGEAEQPRPFLVSANCHTKGPSHKPPTTVPHCKSFCIKHGSVCVASCTHIAVSMQGCEHTLHIPDPTVCRAHQSRLKSFRTLAVHLTEEHARKRGRQISAMSVIIVKKCDLLTEQQAHGPLRSPPPTQHLTCGPQDLCAPSTPLFVCEIGPHCSNPTEGKAHGDPAV